MPGRSGIDVFSFNAVVVVFALFFRFHFSFVFLFADFVVVVVEFSLRQQHTTNLTRGECDVNLAKHFKSFAVRRNGMKFYKLECFW